MFSFETDRGSRWADGEAEYCLYDHHYPPNASDWDCLRLDHSFKPPRSLHTGGVNLLLADGSVRFIADTINLETWRGLGSRSGNEMLADF